MGNIPVSDVFHNKKRKKGRYKNMALHISNETAFSILVCPSSGNVTLKGACKMKGAIQGITYWYTALIGKNHKPTFV
jgi:hypothetical protein